MNDLIKCQICGSDGEGAFDSSHMVSSFRIYCTNADCRNSKMGVMLEDWQSIPIKDHPLKDEILELVKSGKLTIS